MILLVFFDFITIIVVTKIQRMKKFTLFLSVMLLGFIANGQNLLKGKVTDAAGNPLFGAAIYERGTTNGTSSDYDGNYSIQYTNAEAVIVFSMIGYDKVQMKAGNQTELTVALKQGVEIGAIEIVGSRRLNRTSTETPVAVDIIDTKHLMDVSGQLDVNQLLQYAAPSFNSNKQSGADGADHVDPATLRGLGPDQTLVLINGKRRHQSSLINIFGTRGRGNAGTDLNAIPVSSIDHIEVLRDGASAQYGSDAIAGVINIVLKKDVGEFNGYVNVGVRNANPPSEFDINPSEDYDGETRQLSGNYGVGFGEGGYLNMTMDYLKSDHTNRPADPVKYEGDIYRNQFGDAAREDFGFYLNGESKAGENTNIYFFGGFNHRFSDAFAWTRGADEDRNIPEIYPNGFDPHIQSIISDKSFSIGAKSKFHNWTMDVNNTIGSNKFHFYVDETLNASLLEKSPTHFDAGGFQLLQNTTNINMSRLYNDILSGLNVAIGAEHRIENYQIFAGEEGSYATYGGYYFTDITDSLGNVIGQDSSLRPGGSQGFPGFQPSNEVNESRTNIAAYADFELDITKKFMVSLAGRFEDYSDFGSTMNGKIAARYKITDAISVRASASSGFRAPSLAQLYYNTTFTDFVAGVATDKIVARNNSAITRSLGIPELKQEKSVNVAGGITAKYKALTLTVDGYYIKIDDRIVLTGAFYSDDPDIGADLQKLDVQAAQFFTNAVNTTTTGVDAVLSYFKVINNKHELRFSLAANFNDMKIDDIYTNDKLKGKEGTYFGIREQYFMLASAPKSKISIGVEYSVGKFFSNLRLTNFGEVDLINWYDNGDNVVDMNVDNGAGGTYDELDHYDSKTTVDLTLGYKFRNLRLSIGAANLLNAYPNQHDPGYTESGGLWDAVQMGFSGPFYFAKLGFKF